MLKLAVLLVFVGLFPNKMVAQGLVVHDSVIVLAKVLHNETVPLVLHLSNKTDFPVEVLEIHNNKPPKVKLPWWGTAMITPDGDQKLDFLFKAPKGEFVVMILLESTLGSHRITIKGNGTTAELREDQGSASMVKTFYPRGNLFATYEDMRDTKSPDAYNQKHYKRTYYYRNGQVQSILTFKSGTFNEEAYYPNGQPMSKGDYKGTIERPLKYGEWTFWHFTGQLKAEGKYKHGLKTGYHKEWFSNGEFSTRARYKVLKMAQQDKTNEAVLIRRQSSADWFESYYENGNKRYDYRKITRGGMYFAYYPNGQLNHMLFNKKGIDQIDNRYCYDGTVIQELDLYRAIDKTGTGKTSNATCYPYAGQSLLHFFKPYLLPF